MLLVQLKKDQPLTRAKTNAVRKPRGSTTGSPFFVSGYTIWVGIRSTDAFPVNMFSDVIIICLPVTMVMRLQMKLKQRLGVATIFLLGFFVIISSSTYQKHSGSADINLQTPSRPCHLLLAQRNHVDLHRINGRKWGRYHWSLSSRYVRQYP